MNAAYTESIPNDVAIQLLGNDYSDEEQYTLIAEPSKFVINCKNIKTGEEREVTLKEERD